MGVKRLLTKQVFAKDSIVRGFMQKLCLLIFGLLLISAGAVLAVELPENFLARLAPIEGIVVMPIDQNYLIDLDAKVGVHAGDLFAVVQPGKPVVHPETGKVIGHLDEFLGYLQVTQVRSGYSYARPLAPSPPFAKGSAVRRFAGIDAFVVNQNPDLAIWGAQLIDDLPQFNWRGPLREQPQPQPDKMQLAFLLDSKGLTVQTLGGQIITQVAATELSISPAAPSIQEPSSVVVQPNAGAAAASAQIAKTQIAASSPNSVLTMPQTRTGLWRGPRLDGEAVGLAGGDFDGDGKQEIAQLLTKELIIFELLQGELKNESQIQLTGVGSPLSFDAFDIDQNGQPELFVGFDLGNGEIGTRMIVKEPGGYQLHKETSPWLVRRMNRPDDVAILAGQRPGSGEDLTDGALYIMASDVKLQGTERLNAPVGLSIFSAQLFADEKGTSLWAGLTMNDNIKIFNLPGDILWRGDEAVGGHRAGVERKDPDSIRGGYTQKFYRQARIDLGPKDTLLVPTNEGPRFLPQQRNYSKSYLVAYRWDGFSLREAWRTPEEQAYLADFAIFDADNDGVDELVTTLVTNGGVFGLGTSHSLFQIYELP